MSSCSVCSWNVGCFQTNDCLRQFVRQQGTLARYSAAILSHWSVCKLHNYNFNYSWTIIRTQSWSNKILFKYILSYTSDFTLLQIFYIYTTILLPCNNWQFHVFHKYAWLKSSEARLRVKFKLISLGLLVVCPHDRVTKIERLQDNIKRTCISFAEDYACDI